jgi:asparagine synthase (glutamine-hydrolysing)
MCGIAGYIGKTPRTSEQINNALNTLKNRGPNFSNHHFYHFEDKSIDFLHTRLSIIDLDHRSNQPYEDGHHSLIFNGEIYNYLEVRAKLENKGWKFITTGDTEVLFYALKQWGKDALTHLNGMWAFAFLDLKQQTVWLCRDRFGEKPFYLRRVNGELTFASEVKTIESLRSEREVINHEHIMRYMTLGYKSLFKDKHTFFKNISELPKGHLLEIQKDGKETITKYWQPHQNINTTLNYDDAVEGFKEKLINSVKTRMRTDVPLAFCLSGGVDSTSLASIATKVCNMNIQTYSIIDDDPRYNESDNIQATIDDLGCKNTMIHLNTKENHLSNLSDLIQYHDSPVATITYYIHSLLIREVSKDGIKVCLSGTAADEIVTGYYDHFLFHLCEMKEHTDYPELLQAWQTHINPVIRNPLLKDPDLFLNNKKFRDHIFFKQDVFSSYLKSDFQETFKEGTYHSSLLRNRMFNELLHEITPVILHEDDLNCMYYSVENRSPYLDHELVDYAFSIPNEHLIKDGRAKSILRDSVQSILNDQVRLDRRKRGFNAALHSLVDFNDPETRDLIIGDSPIFDYVKRDMIESAINQKELPNSFSKFLFYFINSKIFMEQRS